MLYVMFALTAIVLAAIIVLIWRLWADHTRLSPEDEEREREIASLNDDQANRLSDKQLARPIDTDTGWSIMVRRGLGNRRRRPRR